MLKRIYKGADGILLPSALSLQVSGNPFSLSPNLNTTIDTSKIKIPSTTNSYFVLQKQLNQLASFSFNPFQALSTIGVGTGNSTLMGIGLLATDINNSLPAFLNWKNLSGDNKAAAVSGLAGNALNTLDNMFFSKQHVNDSALTKGMNTAYDNVSNAVSMFSPVGTIVGGAMKAGKFIGDGLSAMGVGTDLMTTTDKILDSNFLKLSPVGLINAFGAKKTKDFSINLETIENVGSDYGGSVNTINDAKSKANKKYGLFSNGARRKANRLIDRATALLNTMTDISDEYLDLLANINDLAYTRYNMNLNGGYLQLNVRWARYGTTLNRIKSRKHRNGGHIKLEWQPIIITDYPILLEANHSEDITKHLQGGELNANSEWQPTISLELVEVAKYGTLLKDIDLNKDSESNLPNIIPEGALHAHKHHMDNAKDLTKKGIPVVDNNGELQAEIERNEIIFNLEVTKKLEELNNKYLESNSPKEKDDLAIEAGKLLVNEIMHNTIDKTGLIKECKKGGTL